MVINLVSNFKVNNNTNMSSDQSYNYSPTPQHSHLTTEKNSLIVLNIYSAPPSINTRLKKNLFVLESSILCRMGKKTTVRSKPSSVVSIALNKKTFKNLPVFNPLTDLKSHESHNL